ncbi:MAG: Gfo/Idh/MocA family oxidoreductase [Candidatus Alcyoniella australis]|nr:Gfo/Idh/MocA family oxidoreductase [Candidatus Alcyoniella australis]
MSAQRKPFNIGVVGLGHWGPNHVRVFSQLPDSQVTWVCDSDRSRAAVVSNSAPQARFTADLADLLADPQLDALVVSTPTATHAKIVRRAMKAGKDVLCEKPLCQTLRQSTALAQLAERESRVLMTGHIFLFHAAVAELKKLHASGALGKLHYMHAERTNLGPFRYDVGAVHDLASHDISIFNWLLNAEPEAVNAVGRSSLQQGIEDYAFVTLHYPQGIIAHVHASWLNPRKVREITIVGDKQMVVFDDLSPIGPIALYRKTVVRQSYADFGEFNLLAREGDLHFPKVQMREPLKAQAESFLRALRTRRVRKSDPQFSLGVMRVLDAVQRSMRRNGARVALKEG